MIRNKVKQEINRQNKLLRLKYLQQYLDWYDRAIAKFNANMFLDDCEINKRYLYRLEIEAIKRELNYEK